MVWGGGGELGGWVQPCLFCTQLLSALRRREAIADLKGKSDFGIWKFLSELGLGMQVWAAIHSGESLHDVCHLV